MRWRSIIAPCHLEKLRDILLPPARSLAGRSVAFEAASKVHFVEKGYFTWEEIEEARRVARAGE